MSLVDLQGICKILNRTRYRVLAWYFDEERTREAGLTNVKYLCRMPMQSTGKEKFSVYVFLKEGSIAQKKRGKKI